MFITNQNNSGIVQYCILICAVFYANSIATDDT